MNALAKLFPVATLATASTATLTAAPLEAFVSALPQKTIVEKVAGSHAKVTALVGKGQDRVMLGSGVVDPHYAARRRGLLRIAVQCDRADLFRDQSVHHAPKLASERQQA